MGLAYAVLQNMVKLEWLVLAISYHFLGPGEALLSRK